MMKQNVVADPATAKFVVVAESGFFVGQALLLADAKSIARTYSTDYKKNAYIFKAVWKAETAITLTETDL